MTLSSGLLTLMLSLNTPGEFKQKTLLCSGVKYTFMKETVENVGLKHDNDFYYTEFKDINELQKELDKQCKRGK